MKQFHPLLSACLIALLSSLIFLNCSHLAKASEQSNTTPTTKELRGIVTSVDNSEIITTSIGHLGSQEVTVLITAGPHKGETIRADNSLIGSFEYDEVYDKGDQATLAIQENGKTILHAKMLSQYRQGGEELLFAIFVLLLIVYARFIGFKALLSFIAAMALFWKFLLPALLAGSNPLLISGATLLLLVLIIMFLVAGFTRKAIAAALGTIGGLAIALALTIIFGDLLKVNGMTQPFAPTLMISGYYNLDMQDIFYAAILIGASGAAMDIAMDVAAAMYEVKEAKPTISPRSLIRSGFNVGRAVVGTMTTTLLLAYSGGYLTMLMLFVSKDASTMRILNFKMVAAEIFRTLVGSIGLVMVAPLTALIAAWLYTMIPIPHKETEKDSLLIQPQKVD